MAKIIAGMYELQQQIGAGGGGIVYLGRHIRLNKQIILKADKRRLNTDQTSLRREVDLLKQLSHSYIPQVYDFVEEDGIVYTVMDYVDGESLDKRLSRGERAEQSVILGWACQLLEALEYLHSRPPHGILHSDIKPANIMIRRDGTVCLIDYNIALALGEDGAVKVGYSLGYASPEHYGLDEYAGVLIGRNSSEYPGCQATIPLSQKKNAVKLDVRSDIYSLGATLYHLISGQRPRRNPDEVLPLGTDMCSPTVAAIIQKAMAKQPENRYQSAKDMLLDIRRLPVRDIRMVRYRRRVKGVSLGLGFFFFAGAACTFAGMREKARYQETLVIVKQSEDAARDGRMREAVELALKAIPENQSVWDIPVTTEAQKALTDALEVYDLADSYSFKDVCTLPGAPFGIQVSPNGKWAAIPTDGKLSLYKTDTLEEETRLPLVKSAMASVRFLESEKLLCAGEQGIICYDLEQQKSIWLGEEATLIAVSSDGTTSAYVHKNEDKIVIIQNVDGSIKDEIPLSSKSLDIPYNDIFANPSDLIFELNETGSLLAVSFQDGSLEIWNLEHRENDVIIYDSSDYSSFSGGFCGKYFAYTAGNGAGSDFGIIDVSNFQAAGGFQSKNKMRLKTDSTGIYLSEGNLLEHLEPETWKEQELAFLDGTSITEFSVNENIVAVVDTDGKISFFDKGAHCLSEVDYGKKCDFLSIADNYVLIGDRSTPELRVLERKDYTEAEAFSYSPDYYHDEARVSADGKTLTLFTYQDFRIYEKDGQELCRVELSQPERIYDQQFRREGKDSWLEVTWYDGTVRSYDASNGRIREERKIPEPDKSLSEEFVTNRWRVQSSLHGNPEIYDLTSGKKIIELDGQDYLTYVTQIDDMLLTEYVTAEGRRYGRLLDENFHILADLPGLCDVYDQNLYFDFGNGSVRQSRLYSLSELMTLGKQKIQEER